MKENKTWQGLKGVRVFYRMMGWLPRALLKVHFRLTKTKPIQTILVENLEQISTTFGQETWALSKIILTSKL